MLVGLNSGTGLGSNPGRGAKLGQAHMLWVTGRASGLQKTGCWFVGTLQL